MSSVNNNTVVLTGKQVAQAIMTARTPQHRSAATKLKNRYIAQREQEGFDPKWVEAGIKSYITRTTA